MVVVADTSPVTALIHLNKLYLIPMLYGKVYIPATVAAGLNTLIQFGYNISFLDKTDTYILDDLISNLKFRLSEKIYKAALYKAGE
ncbi:MAG TPA: hypothetical protein VFW07_24835 [Parafilimonas sp.]|nr:hypothetical protein [Parafilimonas sp.]